MKKLNNPVQNYNWGDAHILRDMFSIANPESKPIAELWMGAHPNGSSSINVNGNDVFLNQYISDNLTELLGKRIKNRFGELPFLFKVLCAEKALSIQVHPSKTAAEMGFLKENNAEIPLDSPVRNYKDPNHKPELVFALTPFRAMNAFRELSEIQELLSPLVDCHPSVADFVANPDTDRLKAVFSELLNLEGKVKENALSFLKSVTSSEYGIAWRTIEHLLEDYPDDTGLFMPLLLNIIELEPGEAMFLHAETPHAYFKGVGLEVMANSDNVLRAGLTLKHIDVPELLANVIFQPVPYEKLLTHPVRKGNADYFPVPVDDFSFSIHRLTIEPTMLSQCGPAIIFCIDGEVNCSHGGQLLNLARGESAFIGANDGEISISGQGRIARAYADI